MPWGAPFSVYYNIIIEKIMKINDLFEHRSLVAVKLKGCIREHGFTKASIARKSGISRTTLDKLLEGNVDNEHVFDDCISRLRLHEPSDIMALSQ